MADRLLTGVLTDRMDFGGVVVSDWNAHGQVEGCTNESCPQALMAGVDMYMAPDTWKPIYMDLLKRAQSGEIPMARIDENPLEFMRACLLEENIGMPTYNPSWKNRIIRVAEMFHRPTCDKAVDTVGWDGETERFMLPNYSIAMGGTVESIDWPLFADRVPGRELEQPETLSGEELDRPSQNRDLEPLFWAVVGSVIANIIAPALDEST